MRFSTRYNNNKLCFSRNLKIGSGEPFRTNGGEGKDPLLVQAFSMLLAPGEHISVLSDFEWIMFFVMLLKFLVLLLLL